jgi:hypothetical protein
MHGRDRNSTEAGLDKADPPGFAEEPQAQFNSAACSEPHWLSQAELDARGHKADAWLVAHPAEIDALETGTVVLINLETEGYVAGATEEIAMNLYDQRFGPEAWRFLHRVRQPTTIGGGWWALNGEA